MNEWLSSSFSNEQNEMKKKIKKRTKTPKDWKMEKNNHYQYVKWNEIETKKKSNTNDESQCSKIG